MQKDYEKYQTSDVAGKLAKFFIYNPLTPILAIFLIAIGYLSLNIMPREEDPQISISGGGIIVALPGAKPKEIKGIIVKPLEEKIKEISGVEHIYGIAKENVGIVNVSYFIGEDREISNLKLYDKVMQNMDILPKGAKNPLVKPFDIDIDVPILTIAFFLDDNSSLKNTTLYKIVKNLEQEFSKIKNVSKTKIRGGKKRQYNVEVDINKLSGYHLSLGQIMKSLQALTISTPSIKARVKNKLMLFGIKDAVENISDVKNLIITTYNNSPIYLKDIAKVTDAEDIQNHKDATIILNGNKKEQITLEISKLKGTNAVTVANAIVKSLEEKKAQLNKLGINYIITRNYGVRANEAVNELVEHLLITILIIAIVLILSLGWRESLIVTWSVPAILAITLFIAYITGQTINRITLFAFLLSLGLLVDAAIIVIENIHRHMHHHDAKNKEKDLIMIEATDEIGAPTNIATFAIVLTMIPMAFVGGMMGEFMKPIPYNVPVALFASLVVAYIFTPYLANKLLKKPRIKDENT